MNAPSLLLIAPTSAAGPVAREAAHLAFPEANPREFPSVDEAAKQPAPRDGAELVLLFDPSVAAVTEALAATDAGGLRRWAVIVFGRGGEGKSVAASFSPETWQAPTVARGLQAAVRVHELERENARLRGDLSTIGRRISHDLRTPLAAIYTASEGLNEIASEQPDLEVFTRPIATSNRELIQLIERISSVVKASAEPSPLEAVAMGEVVFETLQRLEARLRRQGVSVTQPAKWPTVMGVGAWLDLIWLNLLANALQHGGPNPQIAVGWSEGPDHFQFWVDDHGPGLAPEKAGKLFHPFHLLHRLNAPRGLGLAVVQRLVELQDGTCGHAPRPGGGAHFYFTVPRATPSSRERSA